MQPNAEMRSDSRRADMEVEEEQNRNVGACRKKELICEKMAFESTHSNLSCCQSATLGGNSIIKLEMGEKESKKGCLITCECRVGATHVLSFAKHADAAR